MAQLTKLDIAALRHADDLTVHLSAKTPDGLVRLIQRKRPDERNPFAQDVEHLLSVEVSMATHRGQEALKAGNAQCFAMVGLYRSQNTPAWCALRTLRADDEIEFQFHPDYHTNGYVAMAGLHADSLVLTVRRDGKTIAHWEIATSICPVNSARMCRGVPNSETYNSDAAEARKVV